MKIKEITSQHRRDFRAVMVCEHCGNVEKNVRGYDDSFFHNTVIPKMKCKKCDKMASDSYRPLAPKYNENVVI